MMNEKDFDLDFDFEKEYGFDLPKEEAQPAIEDEFDLESILAEDFGSDDLQLEGEYTPDFDYGPELEDELGADAQPAVPEMDVEAEAEDEIAYDDPILDELLDEELSDEILPEDDYIPADDDAPDGPLLTDRIKEVAADISAKVRSAAKTISGKISAAAKAKKDEAAPRREPAADGQGRKPISPMRKFKNETLPLIILGVSAMLILIFVFGAVSRTITNARLNRELEEQLAASAEAAAQQEAAEATRLLAAAKQLAAGYDYEGAVDLLNTFTGSSSKYPEVDQAKAEYTMAQSQMVAYTEVGSIANLSFHVLVVDPQRAYADANYSSSYKNNFVTVSEFEKILEQLYANDFILVDMDDIVTTTTADGVTVYEYASLSLPAGKTPIMISETYGYHKFMDDDNCGFASRLVLDSNGDIKAEYKDASGNVSVGDYALVPILESFIAEHPDFSYKGARATIAVTGYDGVFGYRTNAAVITEQSQEFYNEQVAAAQEIANALRDQGYTLASYSYGNKDFASASADQIQTDLNSWKNEVTPIIGEVDTLIYAKGTDINSSGDYTGSKYTVLYNEGFRYFISSGNKAAVDVKGDYVRQVRLMVTGSQLVSSASTYAGYFDAAAILDAARG